MRLLFLMLLLINIAAIGYIRFAERRAGADDQAALLQINPDKVKLLKPATAPAGDTQKSSSLAAAQRACLEWGTFSPDDSPRVAAALTALQPPLKVSQRQSDDTYWVHIPSLRTRADALNTASQLKARGVGNSFVVQDRDPGELRNLARRVQERGRCQRISRRARSKRRAFSGHLAARDEDHDVHHRRSGRRARLENHPVDERLSNRPTHGCIVHRTLRTSFRKNQKRFCG
jgi:hypothetical protein